MFHSIGTICLFMAIFIKRIFSINIDLSEGDKKEDSETQTSDINEISQLKLFSNKRFLFAALSGMICFWNFEGVVPIFAIRLKQFDLT